MIACSQDLCQSTLTSRLVQFWRIVVRWAFEAKPIVDGSIPTETGPRAISLQDSNVALKCKNEGTISLPIESSRVYRDYALGSVEPASADEVCNYRHQVKSANSS